MNPEAGEPIPTRPTPVSPRKGDAADEQNTEREILLGAARSAVRQKKWDLALGRFEEFFRRFGDDLEVREEYAGVLLQAGRVRDALREYSQLVALHPNDTRLRVAFGDVAVLAQEYPLAILQFQAVLEREPKNLEAAVRLARAYVFDGDPAHAQQVYDRYLARLRPGDDAAPAHLPALLVDLDRPAEALPFLQAALEQSPDDAVALATQVRAYERLGDHARAREALNALAARAPADSAPRRELADALYGSENYDLAAQVYEQILQAEPGQPSATIALARTYVQLFQPVRARQLLDGLRVPPTLVRLYRIAWAEHHRLVGEQVEAKQIYQDLLRSDPSDHAVRFELANLYERMREDEKAKAEYAKVPVGSGLGRQARLGTASVLTTQRRFTEAADIPRHMLAENPGDGSAAAALVRTLAWGSKAHEAAALARGYIQRETRNEPGQAAVRLVLGRALLEARRPNEAAQVYVELLSRPAGRVYETAYGLARARGLLGDKDGARHAVAGASPTPGEETRTRLLVSDLFVTDGDDDAALELALSVAKLESDNLAALVRVAEAKGRLSRQSGDIQPAVAAAQAVLELSPTNLRGRLALARALPTVRDWHGSVSEYDRLITADPELFVPQREKARVLYSASDYPGGAAAYLRIQTPDADEHLRTALAGLAARDPRVGLALGPCLATPLHAHTLKAEVAKALAAIGDSEVAAAVQRILLDYEARAVEQTLAALEGKEKANGWRPYAAIPLQRTLLEAEPSNTSVWFDFGQSLGTVRQTHAEMTAYTEDLQVDPREREAGIALERAGLELNPQLRPDVYFVRQRGRNGLANITRSRYEGLVRLPWGNENEYAEVGYSRVNYRPTDDSPLDGNILVARAQGKCLPTLLLYGQANLEIFPNRFRDRVTFDTGALYDVDPQLRLRGSGFLENVAENGESMRQDIHRGGFRLGADYRVDRRWLLTGTYTYARYSDNNDFNDLYLISEHLLCFAPDQLKFVATADLFGYRNPTVFPPPGGGLVGTVHPYFSPKFFGYCEGRLEWTQWLSRDYFVHANQCWYSLQYGLGFDNRSIAYNTFRGLLNYDVRPWLSVGLEGRAMLASVYNYESLLVYLVLRSPQPLRH